MHHIFTQIINHLEIIVEQGGYAILFLVSILEGVPVIGPIVPGHTIVIFSGFLVKLGILHFVPVIIFVMVGATLGDVIGFYSGRKFGFAFLTRFGKYFFITEDHIEKARKIVQEHTGKAIILGRFSPITRSLAPFAVGASGVHIRSFWFLDLVGVALWAVSSIAVGYLFGASYSVAAPFVGKFIALAIVCALFIIWAYRFINKQFHVFAKYELIALILNLLGLYAFFKTLQDALSDTSFMTALDVWINTHTSLYVNNIGITCMRIVTDIFSPTTFVVVALIGIIYFLYKKQWRYSVITALSFGGGLFINGLVKNFFMRMRPLHSFISETGYSFPSGHATAVTLFAVLAIYFFARKFKNTRTRELYIVAVIVVTILTGFSRLYLGVHWFSDVLAGFSFGLFWATLMILLVRYVGMIIVRFESSSRDQ